MPDSRALIIAKTTINTDSHGRYCLNDLHRASTNPRRNPGTWLRLEATQDLIAELDTQNTISCFDVVKGGNASGVYAHELLAISYAGWISPAFQLKVNQAFLDSKRSPVQYDTDLPAIHDLKTAALVHGLMRIDALEQRQVSQDARLDAIEAKRPPADRRTCQDWLWTLSKPRLPEVTFKHFKAACRRREAPERFQPDGANYPYLYYTPETLEAGYLEATKQISFIHEEGVRYGIR